jgi:hypothetical protein
MNTQILLRSTFLLALLNVPVYADRVCEASSGKAPRKGDLVLFPLDDESIPWRENLKLTLQRPQKYPGNPVLTPGPLEGVDGQGTILYGTVMKDASMFRMWYLASPRADSRIPSDVERMKYYRPVAYAESTDGIHWVKPNLALVPFRGNTNNNLVQIEPSTGAYSRAYDFVAVFYEPEDPNPRRRFKMAYIVRDRLSSSTATAVSADGLRWNLINNDMFTKGHFENTGLIKFDGLYYLSGQNIPPFDAGLPDGSGGGRVMKIFFSPDFRHWSSGRALGFYRSNYVAQPTNFGQETHMGAGLWHRGNVILGFYGRWYGNTITTTPSAGQSPLTGLKMDLGLVVSNDAIHYREPVRDFVMVPHGAVGDWDSESILQANAFANTDKQTLIWYSHWNTSMPTPPLPALPERLPESMTQSIGLLTMPRDRFGYFSKLLSISQLREADNKLIGASCLTRSLRVAHRSELFVNVDDASPRAALEIAVVGDTEKPLPGYTSKIIASSLKERVRWSGHKTLPVNTPFRIKITWPVGVETAKLYAIYIEQQ